MVQDERLREELLAAQVLSAIDSRSLREQAALLQVLEKLSTVSSQSQALSAGIESIKSVIDAQTVFIAMPKRDVLQIASASDENFIGLSLTPANALFKPRNIVDIKTAPQLKKMLPNAPVKTAKSLLVRPFNLLNDTRALIVCLHNERAHFYQEDLAYLERLSTYIANALSTIELRAEHHLLAVAIDGASSGIAIADAKDAQTRLIFVNNAFENITGYSAADVIGKNCRFLADDPKNAPERTRLRKTIKERGAGQFILRNKRKDGTLFWNELTLFPVLDGGGTPTFLVAAQIDATQRVDTEQNLRSTQHMLRQRVAAIENAGEGIGICDEKDILIYANTALGNLLRQPKPEALIGKNWKDFYEDVDDKAVFYEKLAGNAKILGRRGVVPQVFHEVSQREAGQVGTVLIIRDFTIRIEERLRQVALNEELEIARRQDALAHMAASVAHDFNNLLSTINGSALLIATEPGVGTREKTHAERIIAASYSAAQSVNQLLDFGAGTSREGIFDLKHAISEAIKLVSVTLRANIGIESTLCEKLVMVAGDSNDAIQAVINLILNARDAFAEAPGKIKIFLTLETAPSRKKPIQGKLKKDRDYAVICVKDNGLGIEKAIQGEIFEPYFSTKGERGTGIGLSNLARLAEKIGGAIALESTPSIGTAIYFYWPLSKGNEGMEEIDLDADFLAGKTLLLIDDDAEITAVLASFLERFGAEVSQINEPKLALEVLMEDAELWNAVITDYDMPGMTGGDLVHALRENGFAAPIFIVTALARQLDDPHLKHDNVQGIFAKPVNFTRLAHALSDAFTAKD